jgi:hypothetical protein
VLSQTNELLQDSIQAVEGSRAAVEWMNTNLETFLQQQRDFQALLLESVQSRIQTPDTLTSGEAEKTGEEARGLRGNIKTDP